MMMIRAWWYNQTRNVGDMLNPFILRRLSGAQVVWVGRDYEGKILGVGSIFRAVRRFDLVFGSGSMYDEEIVLPAGVRIVAVRGPLTGALLGKRDPKVYGDPAILLERMIPAALFERSGAYKFGLVLNEGDRKDWAKVKLPAGWRMIPTNIPFRRFISEIMTCQFIVSSSLHGIILAEVYGVPAVWLRSDNVRGHGFKFFDYYASTGRKPLCIAEIKAAEGIEFLKIPDFKELRGGLVNAWQRNFDHNTLPRKSEPGKDI